MNDGIGACLLFMWQACINHRTLQNHCFISNEHLLQRCHASSE